MAIQIITFNWFIEPLFTLLMPSFKITLILIIVICFEGRNTENQQYLKNEKKI